MMIGGYNVQLYKVKDEVILRHDLVDEIDKDILHHEHVPLHLIGDTHSESIIFQLHLNLIN